LTRRALGALAPEASAAWASCAGALAETYCRIPDLYYGDSAGEWASWLCFVDGIPFHYIPNEPVEYNNWRMARGADGGLCLEALPLPENVHHRHCREAFLFYFERMAAALRGGQPDAAARLAGSLCHALEDNTMPVHCLEGPDGTDIFVLDRLANPPPGTPHRLPSLALDLAALDPGPVSHAPRLLGLTPAEAGFHLYTAFCETALANRRLLLPLLEAVYAGNGARKRDLVVRCASAAVRLAADVLHTAAVLGGMPPAAAESAALQTVDLAGVRPARRPRSLCGGYRFIGFTRGCCLDGQRNPAPLALRFEGGVRRTYSRGLGLGAHREFRFDYQIPAGVYRSLRGAAGLQAELGMAGHARLQWILDDAVLWQEEFDGRHAAAPFDLDVSPGGWLTLRGEALTDNWSDPANNLVLAEPVLIRIR